MKAKHHNSQVGTILFLDMKVVRGQFLKEGDMAGVYTMKIDVGHSWELKG